MVAIRFPGGMPDRCPICQTSIEVEPSSAGDALCTACGVLVWPPIDQAAADGYKKPASSMLGPYKLVKRLSRNKYGHVFLGRGGHGQFVKINVVARELQREDALIARLLKETVSLAKIDHSSIVRVRSANVDRGLFFIVKQYVAGSTMKTWLDKLGKINVGDAFLILRAAAAGLAHLHRHEIIHRNVDTEKLWASDSGHILLDGIGLAGSFDQDESLTLGGLAGYDYMAPEQARSAKYLDGRSDIYALGSIAYHLLTGVLAFPAETSLEQIIKKETGDYTPATSVDRSLPPVVDRIIARMIRAEPAERFQSADEVVAAIDKSQLAGERLSFVSL